MQICKSTLPANTESIVSLCNNKIHVLWKVQKPVKYQETKKADYD